MLTPFDKYAKTYDDHFTNTLIGKEQRKQVYRHLAKHLTKNNPSILEINCGTGEDAQWLAKKGHIVLATDISEGMIEVAKQKSTSAHLKFQQLNCLDVSKLQPNKYDLLFSNFGGLNCLSPNELNAFSAACDSIQQSNAKLIFVIMSSNCWWENFYFNQKNEYKKANRRQNKNGVDTIIDDVSFKTYYYSPKEIETIFSNHYKVIETKPIGFFVPPSYLEPYFKNRKFIFKCLVLLDKIVNRFSFLSNSADHYFITLKKK